MTEKKVESIRLTATNWAEFPDVDEVRPIGDDDYAILGEIRELLIKRNAISRFGITLIHRHFDLKDNEVIFETTDAASRVQRMEVLSAEEVADHKNVLETQWVFDINSAVKCHVVKCHVDRGHRRIHSS